PEVDERQSQLTRRIDNRQIDVELRSIRVTGGGETGCQLERRLRARVADDTITLRMHNGVGCQAAAETERIAAAEQRRSGLLPEANPELAAGLVVGDHDARLDPHLPHRQG